MFLDREEGVGGDDHEPFLRAGVDAVDIIQLTSYPHWHSADDTIDKVSAQSMKIVGETILTSLPKIIEHVQKRRKRRKAKKGNSIRGSDAYITRDTRSDRFFTLLGERAQSCSRNGVTGR